MIEKVFQNIIVDYSKMSVDSLIEMKNWVEEYPFCQTAQILYLLNLKWLGEDTFDARLPYTAIGVLNRQRLKEEVEKVEKLLGNPAKTESSKTLKISKIQPSFDEQKTVEEPPSFGHKTISELLNLKRPETPTITQVKLPKQLQNQDDTLLEQLRLEALSKVNDRLNEARKTTMVNANFTEVPNRLAASQELIDKVIATNPKISKVDDSDTKLSQLSTWKFKEEHSLREDFELVSETLAQLYIAQGAPAKAREIYKTLSKTHPEKADYFAELSKQIKTNHKSKKTKK